MPRKNAEPTTALTADEVLEIAQANAQTEAKIQAASITALDAAHLPKPTESGPFLMQLRDPLQYYVAGARHRLPAFMVLSSQDFNWRYLIQQGGKLDMVSETGEVLADLNDMLRSGATL